MDYCIWAKVGKKEVLEQERRWPAHRRETRVQCIRRLRRVVKQWPENEIKKAIGDMKRRCELLYRAKGGLFDESEEI